jgi:hypothetical protein
MRGGPFSRIRGSSSNRSKGERAYRAQRKGRASRPASGLALGALRLARRLARLQAGLAKHHAGVELAPCAPHARALHKMAENERRALQQDSRRQFQYRQRRCTGERAYRARHEERASRDARAAELATRQLAMHPAVRLDAIVRHGLASLGCVGHPTGVRPLLRIVCVPIFAWVEGDRNRCVLLYLRIATDVWVGGVRLSAHSNNCIFIFLVQFTTVCIKDLKRTHSIPERIRNSSSRKHE